MIKIFPFLRNLVYLSTTLCNVTIISLFCFYILYRRVLVVYE